MAVNKGPSRPSNRAIVRKAVVRQKTQGNSVNYKSLVGGRPRVAAAAKAMGKPKTRKVIVKTRQAVRKKRQRGGGVGPPEIDQAGDLGFSYSGDGFATTSNIGMQGKAYKLASASTFGGGYSGLDAYKAPAEKDAPVAPGGNSGRKRGKRGQKKGKKGGGPKRGGKK